MTDEKRPNLLERVIRARVEAAMEPRPPHEGLLTVQQPLYDLLNKYWFRLETDGWERVPERTCLVVGVHSGGALTMDAWTLVNAWWTHFEGKRMLHGTAHDVLMATPGLGDYFRAVGVIAAHRDSVTKSLAKGEDVVVWPGGELDSMRSWSKRDVATLGGRTGFVPIISGFPFPIGIEVLPAHLPLPAKIRTEILEPIEVDADPHRANDDEYVQSVYDRVESAIQAGMDRLAAKRRLPVLG